MSLVYVYGVVRAPGSSPGLPGIADAPVRALAHGPVAALVSDHDEEPLGRRRELVRHAEVIETALEGGPVLPLQFGVVYPDDETVVSDLLDERGGRLVELLDEVEGRIEVRLRGFYDEEQVVGEVIAEHPRLATAGSTLDDRIAAGERIAAEVRRKADHDAARIVDLLGPLAEAVADEDPTSPMMMANLAFLLQRDQLERFDEAVSALGEELGERIRLKYVGPLPPASFVDLSAEV